MKTIATKDIKGEIFNSVSEFSRTIASRPTNSAFSKKYCCSLEDDASAFDFTGTTDFSQAQDLLTKGYKDGAKGLNETKTNINIKGRANKAVIKPAIQGFCPIVPNAIKGVPVAMLNRTKVQMKNKTISIVYDCCGHGGLDTDVFFKGGKNVLSLVQQLENTGHRVELYCFSGVQGSSARQAFVSIKIKDFSQALNTQLVAYPLVHPSFFRRHIFRWRETSEMTNYSVYTDGYGTTLRYCVYDIKSYLKQNGILKDNGYYIDVEKAAKCSTLEDMKKALGI